MIARTVTGAGSWAAALHQLLAPLWLGERKPDDAFFNEVNAGVQAIMDRPPA